jgi:uncharacterized OB-fold protein
MTSGDRASARSPVQTEAAQQMAVEPAVAAAPAGIARTLSGRGEVYSFSTMYNVPRGYEGQAPYTIALVKLDDGPMVTAQLTDVDAAEVRIGLRVEMVTRKLREDGDEGQIIYGYKFRPVLPTAAP